MAVNIRILADFDAKGFKQAEQAIGDLGRTAGRVFAGLAIGAGVAAVGAIREFGNFDAALTKSLAIMGDVTDTMRGEMSQAARDVAKATTFSAEQAAESFFFLASAGLDAEASMKALPQVAAFAQAGMFDMARATDLLTDAQSALGLTIRDDAVANMENMIRVSDTLVKANILANASVEQFSTALTTKAGASLRALGKDLEEGVAVLAAFADQGIKGETAGTQLAIVLRDLTTRGIKNKEEFEKFGISVFDANGNMNNMADIVGDLETALEGMSDETAKATLLQLGFSDKSLSSLQALLGTSDAIRGYEAELRNAGGTTEDVAGRQLDTLNSQLELLKSEFLDVAISVGEQMTPAVRDLVDRVKELLPEIGEKLVSALEKVDFAKIAEDVANFTIAVIENIDTIIEVAKQVVITAGVIYAFSTALKVATAAQAIFNAIAMKNPYVIIALAAVTAGIAIANAVAQTNAANNAIKEQATETGRTVEQQKEYNDVLARYLRSQDNARKGAQTGAHALNILKNEQVGLNAELERMENVRFGNLRKEFFSVYNEAVRTKFQLSLVNEELRMIRQHGGGPTTPPPDICPHGLPKATCPICNFKTDRGGQQARDYVQEFYDSLAEEVRKQSARIELQNFGLSEGLVNQILGAQNFDEVFDHIIKGGRRVAQELQQSFNQTAAGLSELAGIQAATAQRSADEAARREAMIQQIVQAQFDSATSRFEKFKALLNDFTGSMASAFDTFRRVLFPAEEFGRFEGAVLSLQQSLTALLQAQTELFTTENRKILEDYVQQTGDLMRGVGRTRDEIATFLAESQADLQRQVESRQSMFETVFNRIVGAADITKFKGGATSIIRQLRRTVEQAINFEQQLNQLRGMGLTDRAIAQIEAAGVEGGAATARALLRGGESAIEEVNGLYEQLADVAEATASQQSSAMFDAGIAMSEGLVQGLIAQQDQMRAAAELMAAVFEEAFQNAVASAAIQFREPDRAAIEAATRAYYDWLDSLPPLAGGEQRQIRGGTVVSGPGTGITMPDMGSGVDYSQPISGDTTIVINVTANDRLGGAAAGE